MRDWVETQIHQLESHQFSAGPQVQNTGVSWAVLQDGKLALSGARGWADREARIPVSPETVFPIASITKSFTASLLVRALHAAGVALEEPIGVLIPEFDLSIDELGAKVDTIDLLAHRCGLPRHDALWFRAELSSAEILSRISRLELNPPDGSGFRKSFQYNNLMYGIAGLVYERLTEKSWAQGLETEFLRPLGMNHTYTLDEPKGIPLAKPYFRDLHASKFGDWSCAPAGSMHSTATDVARWLEYQLQNAAFYGDRTWREWNRVDGAPECSSCFETTGYGLGWFVDNFAGQRLVHHGGSINGYSLSAAFMPERGLGFVVLVNQVQSRIPKALAMRVFSKLLGIESVPEDRFGRVNIYSDNTLMPIFSGPLALTKAQLEMRAQIDALRLEKRVNHLVEAAEVRHPGYGVLRICEQRPTQRAHHHYKLEYENGGDHPKPDFWFQYENSDPWPAWVISKTEFISIVDWLGMPCRMRIVMDEEGEALHVPFNLHPGCVPTVFR